MSINHPQIVEYSRSCVKKPIQVPTNYVGLLNYLFNEVLDGRNAHLTDGVQRALGRDHGISVNSSERRWLPTFGNTRRDYEPFIILTLSAVLGCGLLAGTFERYRPYRIFLPKTQIAEQFFESKSSSRVGTTTSSSPKSPTRARRSLRKIE